MSESATVKWSPWRNADQTEELNRVCHHCGIPLSSGDVIVLPGDVMPTSLDFSGGACHCKRCLLRHHPNSAVAHKNK